MKAKKLREKTREELEQLLDDSRQEFFNLRSQLHIGQVEKPHRIGQLKRDISRLITILKDEGYSHK
ncbi:50S ribosomal protein L29 [bacterium]|nr:50S ribosomal protein L29 [bacterium]